MLRLARSETLRPGEVGIFAYDGDGYIKVYDEQEPEDAEAFTDSRGVVHKQPVLISYNKKYPPRPVSPEASFQIVGRVLVTVQTPAREEKRPALEEGRKSRSKKTPVEQRGRD